MGKLQELEKEIKKCKKCPLWRTRTNAVPGEGSTRARIMLVGEAPGREEDRQGRPFVGAAGKILDKLLGAIKLKRKEIFISNILHCRPPHNRNPRAIEIKACTPYLNQQIQIIKPKIICTLGNFATSYILEKFDKTKVKGISKIHGKVFNIRGIKIIPLYHPAAAVYNPRMLNVLLKDFKTIRSRKL